MMSLFIASLNSGSNGNCYYVGDETDAVFVDAGISCREIEKRMKKLGLPMNMVRAIFVSHEHTDHISGISSVAKKYKLPVYGSAPTLGKLYNDGYQQIPFSGDNVIRIAGLAIRPFAKFHDAVDGHSFTVSGNGVTVGVFTDLGRVCDNLVHHFSRCHAAFLEANYDAVMLEQGRYPYFLKNRIRGGRGHLSNTEALGLMQAHKPSFMTHILLSHLSKDNNHPELALDLFRRHAGTTHVEVASRFYESPVFRILPASVTSQHPVLPSSRQEQLSLF